MQDTSVQIKAQSLTTRSTIGEDGSVTQTAELISPGERLARRAFMPVSGPTYFRTEQENAEGLTVLEMSVHDDGDLGVSCTFTSPADEVTLRSHVVEGGRERGAIEQRQPSTKGTDQVLIRYYPE